MIDTKALREKVLDLAIRGKLVPQDPNDEPASVLLKKIREQKKQMVKDGELKAKDIKNDTIIFKGDDNLHYEQFADATVKCIEDEIPFEVPDGWEWERLGNISTIARGGSPRPIKAFLTNDAKGVNWIKIGDTEKDGKYIFSTKERIKPEGVSKSRFVKSGDFLLTNSMSFGRPYILKTEGCIHDGWLVIGDIELIFDQDYLYYALSAKYMYQTMAIMAGGSIVDNLNSDLVKSLMFPIPPINEQKYIARKVSDLLELVESIKSNEETIVGEISLIKSKILDLAIRGELVPQDPNDEPASVLLDRIRAEKEELIKAGKIKRDKKESVIFKGEDNSYYQNVPNNWSIASLSEITTSQLLNDGDWILSDNMDSAGEVKLIQLGSVGFLEYIDKGFKYLTNEMFEYINCTEIHSGYMLINRIVSDKMTVCILPEISGKKITTVDTCWVAPKENWYNLKFILYSLASPQYQSSVLFYSSGTTRKRISKTNLIALPLAIPPLAEQKRIVKAIETIFAQLDDISNAIA